MANGRCSYTTGNRVLMKGARVIGEFRCPGAAGLLGFTWANKGHPDEQDLENARAFARGLVKG